MRPLDNRLLGDLQRIFAHHAAAESHQLGAANALADFARKDAVRLARLLLSATPGQYEILYPLVAEARGAAARQFLIELVCEAPGAELPPIERVALGQRRAGAAITLLRQGERESILEVLRVRDDPESLTQFVHRCRQRGVLPPQLLECLKLADQLRQSKTGEARRTDDGVLFGLLLVLGEYELAEVPETQFSALVGQLVDWYANDPSSAIHGAAGWLLRHWKQDELARKVDQTPPPYAPPRQWFTMEIKCTSDLGPGASFSTTEPSATAGDATAPPKGGTTNEEPPEGGTTNIYMTFVVFPAGEYLIGSPPDEADRQGEEPRHAVKLTRPIAVSDRDWSGVMTGTGITPPRLLAKMRRARRRARPGCTGAAAGRSTPHTVGRRSASRSSPRTGRTTWAFAWP